MEFTFPKALSSKRFLVSKGMNFHFSRPAAQLQVSLGAADYTSAEAIEESIQLADQAMYRQKNARKSPDRGLRALNIPSRAVTIEY